MNKISTTPSTVLDYDLPLNPDILFPGFETETRWKLFFIFGIVSLAFVFLNSLFLLFLYPFGFVMNILHLIVLTRKSMINNAINVIMASMAIVDILLTICTVWFMASKITMISHLKLNQPYIDVPAVDLIALFIALVLRRDSSWLPILMASTRTIVIKNYDNTKFSFLTTGKYGILSTVLLVTISTLIGVANFFMMITDDESLDCDHGQICNEPVHNSSYYRISSSSIKLNDSISPVLSSLIPSICYPIFTFVLLHDLHKVKKRPSSLYNDNRNARATKMIIIVTLGFMAAELPQTIANCLSIFYGTTIVIHYAGIALNKICGTFGLINSSAHCYICYKMSSSYKDEFNRIFRKSKQNKVEELAQISQYTSGRSPAT